MFFCLKAQATILYFESNFDEYYLNDIFLVDLKIDTQGEKINAAQIEINFSANKLNVVEIIKQESIFILWPQEPSFSNESGKISFVGGVPLGFEGKGKILSVAFKVISSKEKEIAKISFDENCIVLLNDGLGTKANLFKKDSHFLLFSTSNKNPKNELKEKLKKDISPPNFFQVFLTKSPLLFNGQYFLSFFALDFYSGIDHYEIQEREGVWKKTRSNFYLIEDQNLKNEIKIKAVDKAGNEKILVLFLKNLLK